MGNFGDNLRKLREERNVTISMLSSFTGISRRTIYAWEKGTTIPASFSSRKLLAEFFRVDPFYFEDSKSIAEDPLIKEILMRIEKLERNNHNQDIHNLKG